jgi:protein-S-isoprenylcysteine O-methyltransferase Ste14
MFRWLTLVIVASVFAISAYYRHRARQTGETIARRREGALFVLLRAVFALPLFAAILAYLINPASMSWSDFRASDWVRWIGVAIGLLAIPSAWWLFSNLGRNVSETVLTKADHSLVTTGPYQWVRHPLYATGGALLVAVGLIAANWFILLLAGVAVVLVRVLVVPREEQALIAKFGDDYRCYKQRTGAMFPRLMR